MNLRCFYDIMESASACFLLYNPSCGPRSVSLAMNKKIQYILALTLCFAIGLAFTRVLSVSDEKTEHPSPLEGGQLLDLSSFGFTLRVPDTWQWSDVTQEDSLLSLALGNAQEQMSLYLTRNPSGDDIASVPATALIRYYMDSGCDRVRTHEFGGCLFVTYRAAVETALGDEYWTVYETWNPRRHLVIETQLEPGAVLPILATFSFNEQE